MNKIYIHKGFLVIPNWPDSEREYFHILDKKLAKKEECITGFNNHLNINTLEDAEIFIDKHLEELT
jgi:hypothetical protein